MPVDVPGLRRRYGIGPADPTILFCGRLEWQKGPDLLVEAVPSILRHHPNTKFIFAGDGGMRKGLENRVRRIGAGHSVRFLGYRGGVEIVEIFRMSDGVCVPSRNEPFGIVILEAWSAEVPVVVTKMGGPGEFVQDGLNGLKVFPDPDSIARGLGRLLSDLDLARRMGAKGRQVVLKEFGWDVNAPQTLGVYGFGAEAPVEVEAPQVRSKASTGRVRKSGSRRQRAAIAAG
jgi:glycosyltransferase involved in cell wall biosynthesis